jgi:hypothetical protein
MCYLLYQSFAIFDKSNNICNVLHTLWLPIVYSVPRHCCLTRPTVYTTKFLSTHRATITDKLIVLCCLVFTVTATQKSPDQIIAGKIVMNQRPHAHSLTVRIPNFSRRSGLAHIPTLADAVQGRAGQRDAERETLRDTV